VENCGSPIQLSWFPTTIFSLHFTGLLSGAAACLSGPPKDITFVDNWRKVFRGQMLFYHPLLNGTFDIQIVVYEEFMCYVDMCLGQ